MSRVGSSNGPKGRQTRRVAENMVEMQRPASAGPSRSTPQGPMNDGSSQFWMTPNQQQGPFAPQPGYHVQPSNALPVWDGPGMQPVLMSDGTYMIGMPPSLPGSRRQSITPGQQQQFDEEEHGDFMPMDDENVYAPQQYSTPQMQEGYPIMAGPSSGPRHMMQFGGHGMRTSPMPMAPPGAMGGYTSPTDSMHMHHPQYATPTQAHAQLAPQHIQYKQQGAPPPRPNLPHRHTVAVPATRPAPLQRHFSTDGSMRGGQPMHDVFAAPSGLTPRRTGTFDPLALSQYDQDFLPDQGISPARALGPAPVQQQHFSPHHDDPLVTPIQQKNAYAQHIRSSTTPSTQRTHASTMSVTSTASSSVMTDDRSYRRGQDVSSDDDENDSPTRAPSTRSNRLQLNAGGGPPAAASRRPLPTVTGPARNPRAGLPVAKPVVSGGRTSAKFSKVAADPGVEGIPPGPRPMDRPSQSFACIIGQAILSASAGGLSLEHIYRYVETAYPFFKGGDGAWRNSVRHNLSIHKMFETIPRTEKFPPGKGGIWIIHEEEKCHWPAPDKFTKNFQPSVPHYHVCRQTAHERQKEAEAKAKAEAEGRVYVPKKGKKGRKAADAAADSMEMSRSFSHMSDASASMPSTSAGGLAAPQPMSATSTPTLPPAMLQPPVMQSSSSDYVVESDFVQMEEEAEEPDFTEYTSDPADSEEVERKVSPSMPPSSLPRSAMVPPKFNLHRKRPIEDEENVFLTTTAGNKRPRGNGPLGEISPMPQQTSAPHAVSYVTPERERTDSGMKMSLGSSVFKTPALVNTSSSPGSSPMPPTIGRDAHRNPSALQQAWTTDDFVANAPDSPPRRQHSLGGLDAAFDIRPKGAVQHRSMMDHSDEPLFPASPPRLVPRTPASRSSAARDQSHQTPRPKLGNGTPSAFRTPGGGLSGMFGSSPYLPPPAGIEQSTPAWEMSGVLHRLQGGMESPSRTGGGSRSPGMPSPMSATDPRKYAFLMNSGNGSPKRARVVSE